MRKKALIAIIIFNLLLGIYIGLLSLHQYKSTHFSCQGEFTGANDRSTIRNRIYLNFSGQQGSSFLDGELTTASGAKQKVRVYYQFSFTRKGNEYSIIQQSPSALAGNEVDEAALKPLFPEYMTSAKKNGHITLYRVSPSAFIVSNSYLPIFYCRLTDRHG